MHLGGGIPAMPTTVTLGRLHVESGPDEVLTALESGQLVDDLPGTRRHRGNPSLAREREAVMTAMTFSSEMTFSSAKTFSSTMTFSSTVASSSTMTFSSTTAFNCCVAFTATRTGSRKAVVTSPEPPTRRRRTRYRLERRTTAAATRGCRLRG